MSFKRNTFNFFIHLLRQGLKIAGKTGSQISSDLIEGLNPITSIKTKRGTFQFFCPGRLPLNRAETLLTKEPETIEWIDGFEENSVFWDIGANVGVYSLYAGLKKGVVVLSFEPASFNYYVLNRNIQINQMENKIFALAIAFNNLTLLDYFHMRSTEFGSALHSFSKITDWQGKSFSSEFKQGMIGFTIDEFILRFQPQFPSHIKIDVDGIEHKVVEGGRNTLADERLKSILVELDDNQPEITKPVISTIQQAGLKLKTKKHASMFDNSEFSSVFNYIFLRS